MKSIKTFIPLSPLSMLIRFLYLFFIVLTAFCIYACVEDENYLIAEKVVISVFVSIFAILFLYLFIRSFFVHVSFKNDFFIVSSDFLIFKIFPFPSIDTYI